MAILNPQAEELNRIIKTQSPTVYELLSKKGKRFISRKRAF